MMRVFRILWSLLRLHTFLLTVVGIVRQSARLNFSCLLFLLPLTLTLSLISLCRMCMPWLWMWMSEDSSREYILSYFLLLWVRGVELRLSELDKMAFFFPIMPSCWSSTFTFMLNNCIWDSLLFYNFLRKLTYLRALYLDSWFLILFEKGDFYILSKP